MASADLFNSSTFGSSTSNLFGDSDLLDSAIKQPNNIDLMSSLTSNMFGDAFAMESTTNGGGDGISASTVGTLEESADSGLEQDCKICL